VANTYQAGSAFTGENRFAVSASRRREGAGERAAVAGMGSGPFCRNIDSLEVAVKAHELENFTILVACVAEAT
jgi:hypothetical protein